MDAADNKKSLMPGVPGMVLQVVGKYVLDDIAGVGVALLGTGLLIAGLCFYARGKGYPMLLGLIGVFSIIGLIILAVLPDKRKEEKALPTQ
jgi:hypothetical protein